MEANNSLVYVHARPHVASLASIFYVGKGSDSRSTLFSRRNPHHMNIIRKWIKPEDVAISLSNGWLKCRKANNEGAR